MLSVVLMQGFSWRGFASLWLHFPLAVVRLQYLSWEVPVWLCVLMSGEENLFPRQYIGKPLWLHHMAWFT